jgi:hypothetical protein
LYLRSVNGKKRRKKLIDCRESRFSLSSGKKKPSVG